MGINCSLQAPLSKAMDQYSRLSAVAMASYQQHCALIQKFTTVGVSRICCKISNLRCLVNPQSASCNPRSDSDIMIILISHLHCSTKQILLCP
jgi:hypothetical protein